MKRIKNIVLAALVAVSAFVPLLATLPAAAAPTNQTSSSALSIEPRKNYVINPGNSVKDTMVIQNLDGDAPLDLTLNVVDFTYDGSGGVPRLDLNTSKAPTTWSLRDDLTVPETVVVNPGASKTINLSVHMPSNIGPGSYYSAIVYSSGSGSGGNVGLSASGATLVFVTVPGKVSEGLDVEHFGAIAAGTEGTESPSYIYFATDKPLALGYTLKNKGNVTEAPVGTITYKWMFGKEQTIDNINIDQSIALIGQTRTFTTCIQDQPETVNVNGSNGQGTACDKPSLWPGYYSLHLDAFYGQNGNTTQEIFANGGFWYLPWWFVVAAIIIILLIAYFVWRLVVLIRRVFGIKPKQKNRSDNHNSQHTRTR